MCRIILLLSVFFIIAILFACAPGDIPLEKAVTKETPFPKTDSIGKEPWQVEWEKTLELAKKEGKVVVYSSAGGQLRDALIKGFKAGLGLNAEIVSGSGVQMTQKLLTENRAGLQVVDIYIGGSDSIFDGPKAQGLLEYLPSVLVLPEVKDGKYWYKGELRWLDADKKILATWAYVTGQLIVNSNLVNEKELLSAKELLNPKWKRKIIMGDPSIGGSSSTWVLVVSQKMGLNFVNDFVAQEPTITRDNRLMIEWVAQGKFAINIGAQNEMVSEFMGIGAPLRVIVQPEISWLSGGSGNIAFMKTAPHPNAAKVFVNWLLSREGQVVFSKAGGVQSGRIDTPTDYLDPYTIRDPNIDYFIVSHERNRHLRVESQKLAREIFSPLLK